MAIDKKGSHWVGSEPEDLRAFLEAYSDASARIGEFRLAKCRCGSVQFRLEADDNEGVARRTCIKCKEVHVLFDGEDAAEDAELEKWRCEECRCARANVGVGVAEREGQLGHWIYVGERCAKCGLLGCFARWTVTKKVTADLLESV